jgi:hypothetical protein
VKSLSVPALGFVAIDDRKPHQLKQIASIATLAELRIDTIFLYHYPRHQIN